MRTLAVLTSAALLATVTTVVTAPLAVADDFVPSRTLTRSSWGYTDQGTPTTGHADPATDAPIGSWTDRRWHRTRSYFTFDVAEFLGKNVITAVVSGRETTKCDRREVELWRTEPYRGQSWLKQPKQLELLGSVSGCTADLAVDISGALRGVVARDEKTVTVALRVPARYEHDPRYHRTIANDLKLAVGYNTPPATPTGLSSHAGLGCDRPLNPALLGGTVSPEARFSDADPGDQLTARFAVWPVASPADRLELTAAVSGDRGVTALRNQLAETTYAWQVRAEDGTDVSAWSETCHFTVDRTAPARPVLAEAYPDNNAVGTPGRFVLSGAADVIEFEYEVSPGTARKRVTAGQDGTATVEWTPGSTGRHELFVTSIDRAGNQSPIPTRQVFQVRENRPTVYSNDYGNLFPRGGIGVAGVFHFEPGLPNVTEYSYRLNDGPTQTVAADAAGKASVTVTPTVNGQNTLFVSNKSASGEQSIPSEYGFLVDDSPYIKMDYELDVPIGTDVAITFSPNAPGVTAYEWKVDPNGTFTRVDAGPDGKATVHWLARDGGYFTLKVRSVSGDAPPSRERVKPIRVDIAEPRVTLTGATKPGEPGELTFRTSMLNPVSYTYQFEGDPVPQTVPAGSDGRAVVPWTPNRSGLHKIDLYATNAAGINTYTAHTGVWVG